jgi:hypothetical protein
MTLPATHWTYLQALAWIRWQQPGIDRYFDDEGAGGRWRACTLYPHAAISAPGLPDATYKVICPNPQRQLDLALCDGRVSAFAIEGISVVNIDPLVWRARTVDRSANRLEPFGPGAARAFLKAAEVMAHWSAASEAVTQRAGSEAQALAWLRAKMADGPKWRGATKEALRVECPIALGPRAWNRVYTKAAADAHCSWSAPGPAKTPRSGR